MIAVLKREAEQATLGTLSGRETEPLPNIWEWVSFRQRERCRGKPKHRDGIENVGLIPYNLHGRNKEEVRQSALFRVRHEIRDQTEEVRFWPSV